MKFIFIALVAIHAIPANAARREEDRCNQFKNLKKVQEEAVTDIRSRITEVNPRTNAYSFRTTNVFPDKQEGAANLSVYFEDTEGPFAHRQAHLAQYSVRPDTCAIEFSKMQPVNVVPYITLINESCNYPAALKKVRAKIVTEMTDLYQQIYPGSEVTNFSFTQIERVDGAGDIAAVFEARVPGLLSVPAVVEYRVDPSTCDAKVGRSTSFTNLFVSF